MSFRCKDVFLPSQEVLARVPWVEPQMQGVIVAFSDSGPKQRAFAIVEIVGGLRMVVPVEKLSEAGPSPSGK